MNFTPTEPQVRAVDFILKNPRSYLAIGMGIGKTSSVLSAFCELYDNLEVNAMLVVAPLRVCNLTWPMEVRQWDQFKHLRVANLRTPLGQRAFLAGMASIYLINYESIPLLVRLVEKRGGTVPYDMVVFDEATKAKNPKAKRIAAFRKQLPPVDRRIAMSGTPAPNSLLDLWAQVRLLDDGERFGHSFEQFKRTYFHATDYMEYNWVANDGAKERIEQKISDITLVLRSKDWLTDVPEPVFEDVEIKMDDALAAQYRKFEQELIMDIRNAQITAMNAAALVTKLLQFTSGAIYDGDKVAHTLHDLKLEALRKIRKDTKGPVLVAINFKHEQDRIRKMFPDARFFADAKTQQSQIDLLAQWNRREIPMLVVHPKSCGHGLNIQFGSNTIVYTSLPWSRENYEQTIARLVRRGQKEVTTVYRLMCPGTVDDAIATSLENKKDTEQRLLAALMMLESAKELKLNLPEI